MSVRSNQVPLWPMPSKSFFSLQIPQGWRASTKRVEGPFKTSPCLTAAPLLHQIPPLTLLSWSAPKRPQCHIMQWQQMCRLPAMSLVTVEARVTVIANCPTEDVCLRTNLWWCAAISIFPFRPASERARWACCAYWQRDCQIVSHGYKSKMCIFFAVHSHWMAFRWTVQWILWMVDLYQTMCTGRDWVVMPSWSARAAKAAEDASPRPARPKAPLGTDWTVKNRTVIFTGCSALWVLSNCLFLRHPTCFRRATFS